MCTCCVRRFLRQDDGEEASHVQVQESEASYEKQILSCPIATYLRVNTTKHTICLLVISDR